MRWGSSGSVAAAAMVIFVSYSAGTEVAKPPSEIASAIQKLLAPGKWEVVHYDERPTVKVDGHRGYRIVLRTGGKRLSYQDLWHQFPSPRGTADGEKVPSVMKYSHCDLVLFPSAESVSGQMKGRIPWLDVEQEYYTVAAHLGEGDRYIWFGRTSIFTQHWLREKMGLVGGDDPLRLAAYGLTVRDDGNCTANSCAEILASAGEKAIPYAEETISGGNADAVSYAFGVLGRIPGQRSTEILRTFYRSSEERLSRGAAYGLVHQPYREAAKDEYLDILRRQLYVREAVGACVRFAWTEAVPVLQQVCGKPCAWYAYRVAFEAKRELEGRPIPADALEAERLLLQSAFAPKVLDAVTLEAAKARIMDSADPEAAAVIAINLALYSTKGRTNEANTVGQRIVLELPGETTRPMVSSLIQGIQNQAHRGQIAALLLPR